jgi:hypothetical protein
MSTNANTLSPLSFPIALEFEYAPTTKEVYKKIKEFGLEPGTHSDLRQTMELFPALFVGTTVVALGHEELTKPSDRPLAHYTVEGEIRSVAVNTDDEWDRSDLFLVKRRRAN